MAILYLRRARGDLHPPSLRPAGRRAPIKAEIHPRGYDGGSVPDLGHQVCHGVQDRLRPRAVRFSSHATGTAFTRASSNIPLASSPRMIVSAMSVAR